MIDQLTDFASWFFVTGDPLIYGADVSIVLTTVAIVFVLTYFKKWGWLWREWLTTVDHKRIGIMYLIASLLMLFRGGVDALLMRTQLALPEYEFPVSRSTITQIFTTHGTIMILFMAMPLMFGLFNIVVPLQIGARDVAYPFLNALSFWLFFFGAMLFNMSLRYRRFAGCRLAQLSAAVRAVGQPGRRTRTSTSGAFRFPVSGRLTTGINFIVTILKMRAPGMKLMKMPMFTWSVFSSCIIDYLRVPDPDGHAGAAFHRPLPGRALLHDGRRREPDDVRQPDLDVGSPGSVYRRPAGLRYLLRDRGDLLEKAVVRLQIHGIRYDDHQYPVLLHLGASLLHDGLGRRRQRLLRDHDDGDRDIRPG